MGSRLSSYPPLAVLPQLGNAQRFVVKASYRLTPDYSARFSFKRIGSSDEAKAAKSAALDKASWGIAVT
jgi:hypothetical protein